MVEFLEAYAKSIIALGIALVVLFFLISMAQKLPLVGEFVGHLGKLANGTAYNF
jgi:hypothetical protein